MARVLVLTADLLFGSRLHASLAAAGHDVNLVAGEDELHAALGSGSAQALLVDLTDEQLTRSSTRRVWAVGLPLSVVARTVTTSPVRSAPPTAVSGRTGAVMRTKPA